MRVDQVQEWLAREIFILKQAGAIRCHLCVGKNKINIHQHMGVGCGSLIQYVFTEEQVSDGLSYQEWDIVTRIVLKFLKECELCKTV